MVNDKPYQLHDRMVCMEAPGDCDGGTTCILLDPTTGEMFNSPDLDEASTSLDLYFEFLRNGLEVQYK